MGSRHDSAPADALGLPAPALAGAAYTITAIRPADGRRAAKTIAADGTMKPAANVIWWHRAVRPAGSLAEIYTTLREAQAAGAAIVRGDYAADDPVGVKRSKALLGDTPKAWLALDVDGAALPPGTSWLKDGPAAAADAIVAQLPDCFQDVSYIWLLTASHGLVLAPGKRWTGAYDESRVNLRLFFMLDRPLAEAEARALLVLAQSRVPQVDLAMALPAQMVYVARPVCHDGSDPLDRTGVPLMGRVERELDRVPVPVPAELEIPARFARAEGAAGQALPYHPTAKAAVLAIGAADETGAGVVLRNMLAAVRKQSDATPKASAADIAATVRALIFENETVIRANLAATGRPWADVLDKLPQIQTFARWCVEKPGARGADGFGGRKKVQWAPGRGALPPAETVAEARSRLGGELRPFLDDAAAWRSADAAHKAHLAERSKAEEARKAFEALPFEERLGRPLPPVPALLDAPAPPARLVTVATGIGKSQEIYRAAVQKVTTLRREGDEGAVVIAVPRHELAEEGKRRLLREPLAEGLRVQIIRGRLADDPAAPGELMCLRPELIREVQKAGLDVNETVCRQKRTGEPARLCPFFETCAYQRQKVRADIYFVAHQALFHDRPEFMGDVAAGFVDESPLDAALWGHDGAPVEFVLERLREKAEGLRGDTLGLLAAELDQKREALLRALDGLPPGAVPRAALVAAGLTATTPGEAAALEWKRKREAAELGLRPDMPEGALRAALAGAKHNGDVAERARVWRALETVLAPGGAALSGHAELVVRPDGVRVLRLRGCHPVRKGWQVPTLIADATADPALLRHIWPNLVAGERRAVAMPHVRVRQMVDRSLSHGAIAPKPEADCITPEHHARRKAARNNVQKLRAAIIKAALEYGGAPVLAIMPKATEEAMRALGALPNWLALAHHGAVTGLDEYRDVRAVFVVGRPLAPAEAVERMAGALTGQAPSAKDYHRTDTELPAWRGAEAGAFVVKAWRHPDATAEALRWQITEGAVIQAVGRGRGVNRTAANPLDVHIWSDIAVPELGRVEAELGDDHAPTVEDEMLAAGCWLDRTADAARVWPDLGNAKALGKARERARERARQKATFAYRDYLIGKCRLLVRVSYRRDAERTGAAEAFFVPGVSPADPRAWLEACLGPLASFEVLPAAEAQPLVAGEVSAARDGAAPLVSTVVSTVHACVSVAEIAPPPLSVTAEVTAPACVRAEPLKNAHSEPPLGAANSTATAPPAPINTNDNAPPGVVVALFDRLRQSARDAGVPLGAVARQAGVSHAHMSNIEAGRRALKPDQLGRLVATVERLAAAPRQGRLL